MPQIIQNAVKAIVSPFVTIRCWSTLPDWVKERWMEVHPSKHLVLINGYTHQSQWHEGDTYISYKYPKALAERWRNYFNNQIIDVSHELWKDYHFIGSTDRIHVFGRRFQSPMSRSRVRFLGYPSFPLVLLLAEIQSLFSKSQISLNSSYNAN